jgi:hypothetical protein
MTTWPSGVGHLVQLAPNDSRRPTRRGVRGSIVRRRLWFAPARLRVVGDDDMAVGCGALGAAGAERFAAAYAARRPPLSTLKCVAWSEAMPEEPPAPREVPDSRQYSERRGQRRSENAALRGRHRRKRRVTLEAHRPPGATPLGVASFSVGLLPRALSRPMLGTLVPATAGFTADVVPGRTGSRWLPLLGRDNPPIHPSHGVTGSSKELPMIGSSPHDRTNHRRLGNQLRSVLTLALTNHDNAFGATLI